MTDLESALRSLPHGDSFRFVDELVELHAGERAMGRYHVRGDEPFLEGHFPGRPMVPGVLMIEAVAQVGGIVSQTSPGQDPEDDLRLAAVRSAKILGTAFPGDTLSIEAELRGRLGALVQIHGTVKNGEAIILETQVTLAGVQPPPSPASG